MSGEDWSDYSSDDPEYEISDHSEMSDSDGSYSDTDDEDIPTRLSEASACLGSEPNKVNSTQILGWPHQADKRNTTKDK
ncbi:hypothetical protein FQA39_LY07644 [Lamprigera yunnana]|nr:hypothetical protein FQA39_LY07644 [Lamprigera yunnana]